MGHTISLWGFQWGLVKCKIMGTDESTETKNKFLKIKLKVWEVFVKNEGFTNFYGSL